MGDHADDALDDVEDTEALILDYKLGQIDDSEAFDLGLLDECGNLDDGEEDLDKE